MQPFMYSFLSSFVKSATWLNKEEMSPLTRKLVGLIFIRVQLHLYKTDFSTKTEVPSDFCAKYI